MQEISLAMIVKNEEKTLERCLNSIKEIANEIIIVDTGSTDKTIEIAKKFQAKIFNFKWINDFSAARNESLKHVSKDWVLILDADDIFDPKSIVEIKQAVKKREVIAYHIDIYNHSDSETQIFKRFVLFRNNFNIKYEGKVHNQIYSSINNAIRKNPNMKISNSNIAINHYGYSQDILLDKDKINRNRDMLNEALSEENISLEQELFYKSYLAQIERNINNFKTSKEIIFYIFKKIDKYNKLLYYEGFSAMCFINLIEIYWQEKKIILVEETINKALKYFPKVPSFYYYLGVIYTNNRRYKKAIILFQKCLEFSESKNYDGRILIKLDYLYLLPSYNIAYCFTRLKNYQKAKNVLFNLLKNTPKYSPAIDLLKRIEIAIKLN